MTEPDTPGNAGEFHQMLVRLGGVRIPRTLCDEIRAAGEGSESLAVRVRGEGLRQLAQRLEVAATIGILEFIDALGQRNHKDIDRLLGGGIFRPAGVDRRFLVGGAHLGAYRTEGRRTERPVGGLGGLGGLGEFGGLAGPGWAQRSSGVAIAAEVAQAHRVQCFACNVSIELGPGQRIGFRDSCEACSTDLHVCRNCTHHEPSAYNECRESSAEWVSDRDRGNRCEYFTPGTQRGGGLAAEQSTAKSQLDSLFKKG